MTRLPVVAALAALTSLFLAAAPAHAADMAGLAQSLVQEQFQDTIDPKGIDLRDAASPVAEQIHSFYNAILVPMKVGISLLILGLIIWVVLRFNKRANPNPAKFSHNTLVEVIWTAVPVFILLIIAVPSFELLQVEDVMPDGQVFEYEKQPGQTQFGFANDFPESRMVTKERHIEVAAISDSGAKRLLQADDDFEVAGLGEERVLVTLKQPLPANERLVITAGRSRVGAGPVLGLFGPDRSEIVPAPTLTIKATGYQWGWAYSYPEYGDFEFDALMAPPEATTEELYRLATTNDIVVPAGETVRIITTARDVIHSWAMPAFGIKIDAIPGRLNETWFKTDIETTFYGQCSEICGKDHSFMPISLRVVSREEFEAWIDERRELEGMEPMFANQELAAAEQSGAARAAALK
ncbi:cytochrome c oxidase subunit II [Parvularcula lutaonensis]|uniref:cytochrome c oxidase subunit II n=1 Tax=Parvularcula lutaonensis TaxID=491923 RepID=UPI00167C32AC|nr:cytochrome c oxidase subunit II [Parvularcula lutaonensis]GGY53044.1 hypothetical protein GCM10007148_22840 [Parvularcula lutaonensis]